MDVRIEIFDNELLTICGHFGFDCLLGDLGHQ
jgi:hypothetical protein